MSLEQFQKDMIDDAARRGADLVRDICAVADLLGDLDTIEYIAENYLSCFNEDQQKDLQEFLKRIKTAKMYKHPGNDTRH